MGKCTHCGEPAGWLRRRHRACEDAFKAAGSAITAHVERAVLEGLDEGPLLTRVKELAAEGRVTGENYVNVVGNGLVKAVQTFLDDKMISGEEQARIHRYQKALNITDAYLDQVGVMPVLIKASLLRSIQAGEMPNPPAELALDLPFLFQKSEKLLWTFAGVEFLERVTRTEYQGRSQGVSIRITKGVYYRTGSFKGNPVSVESLKSHGKGILAFTTKHVYYASDTKSFKVPYGKIVAVQMFTDALQLQKDGTTSKPMIFKGIDGWFAANLVSAVGENLPS